MIFCLPASEEQQAGCKPITSRSHGESQRCSRSRARVDQHLENSSGSLPGTELACASGLSLRQLFCKQLVPDLARRSHKLASLRFTGHSYSVATLHVVMGANNQMCPTCSRSFGALLATLLLLTIAVTACDASRTDTGCVATAKGAGGGSGRCGVAAGKFPPQPCMLLHCRLMRRMLVVGGKAAQDEERYPYMTRIHFLLDDSLGLLAGCGGTLITPRIVLTAAHCMALASKDGSNIFLRVGAYNPLMDEARRVGAADGRLAIPASPRHLLCFTASYVCMLQRFCRILFLARRLVRTRQLLGSRCSSHALLPHVVATGLLLAAV